MNLPLRRIKSEIFNDIEGIVKDKKCSYIDAAVLYSEEKQIDIEQIANILTADKLMIAKIRNEAEDLRLVEKEGAKLDI